MIARVIAMGWSFCMCRRREMEEVMEGERLCQSSVW